MNFYNTNSDHDRKFLKLQTQLNFSYWIAADLEHYFDSCEKDINQLEYKVLLKQYELALDIFNNVDIDASELSVEQKDCLEIHKEHTYKCITEELNFFDKKLTDSESEEINTFHQINQHNNFQTQYMQYLHPNELESYLLRSYSYLGQAVEATLQLCSDLEFDDSKKISKGTYEAYKNFRLSRIELEKAIKDPYVLEGIIDEYAIISPIKSSDKDIQKYCDMQFNFLRLWKDYFYTCENYYSQLFDHDDDAECDAESKLFNYETKNYLGFINGISIRLHLFILKKLNVEVPKIEIYSSRIIKSPIDYIKNNNL
ncbi:hypothetical protein N9A33_01715 [Gammaproteobacteria bacterium]|nr:hypothetical protein [Gammaproteobacteria bacterium]